MKLCPKYRYLGTLRSLRQLEKMFKVSDNKKIGGLLIGMGIFFLLFGSMLFFDSKLMAIGNILFLAGFTFSYGVLHTLEFFGLYGQLALAKWRTKWRGLITFMGGVLMVLSGWGLIGILVELFGFINLFGQFFPVVFSVLRGLPIIGPVLSLPGVKHFVDALSGKTSNSMV
eukprot:maker-scaffold_4-snap-gene-5.66-mRNA-1 protein AED:0.01 eAED:0.01 QI:53/1/1/1/0/0/2/1131/170